MSTAHISNVVKSGQQELDDYLSLVHTEDEIKQGSVLFWKRNSSMFPGLCLIAKKYQYLSIPATSAPIERVFSTAGNILKGERSRITPKNFETLLFLNKFFIIKIK